MAKYRKKPIVIEAEVYRPGLEDGLITPGNNTPDRFIGSRLKAFKTRAPHWKSAEYLHKWFIPFIRTPKGDMTISEGDYIITGIQDERHPCKPDIFEAMHELIDENE